MNLVLYSVFVFVFVSEFHFTSTNRGFLVAAPKAFLAGSSEQICISLHNRESSTPIYIALLHSTSDEIISSKQAVLGGNSSCVSIDIPHTNEEEGRLKVQITDSDADDVIVTSEKRVIFKHDPLVVIISPDKPVYRPGEKIRFRVLCLTHRLKVCKHEFTRERIWIESPNGITVAQWLTEELEPKIMGFVQLDFELSEESLLGEWKIKLEYDSTYPVEEKKIQVKEYILPRFEVTIVQPREILADDSVITYEICAKYSYGAIVKGDMRTEFIVKSQFEGIDHPKIISTMQLNNWTGCATATMSGDELSLGDPFIQPETIQLVVVVTELGSQLSEKVSISFDVLHTAIQLQFHCSQYFKPGLPYKGKLKVLSPGGHPISAVDLPIQICLRAENSVIETASMAASVAPSRVTCWNYTTDYNSQIQFTLPPLLNYSKALAVTAVSVSHKNKFYSGEERWRLLMIQPKTAQALRPWFSPSQSYIEVSTVTPVPCNMEHIFHVQYTVLDFTQPTPLFHFIIESRGDLLEIGSIRPEKEKKLLHKMSVGFPPARAFTLPIKVTPDMSPESRLVVYYTQQDGEIIAASMFISVEHCFHNKVRVRWSDQQVAPGDKISLTIRAHPYSLCASHVLDSRIITNDIDPLNIWQKLAHYAVEPLEEFADYCANKATTGPTPGESPPDWDLRRRKRSYLPPKMYDYVDAKTAFDDLGVVIMTDLSLETRPCNSHSDVLSYELLTERKYVLSYELLTERKFSPDVPMSIQLENELSSTIVNSDRKRKVKSLVRDFFPESWLWSFSKLGKSGEISLQSKAPHSIASWKATVACLHEAAGFGMNLVPIPLETYLPFYLQLDVPSSFSRTEELSARVIVYNHLSHSLPVKISLETSSGVQLLGPNEESVCVEEFVSYSVSFPIRGTLIGKHNLTVSAYVAPIEQPCGPAVFYGVSDNLSVTINVRAEGFPTAVSHSALICNDGGPLNYGKLKTPWNLSLPDSAVAGSARAWLSVSADLLGPVLQLQELENLVEMPTGCGEQNMIRLAPGILLVQYLDALNPPGTGHLRTKVLNYIQKGYQRQLLYRHPDGSYSAFGPKAQGEEGSMWLTAFVLKSLGQAKNLIMIDEKSLQQTLDWITSRQLENGCFPSVGRIFNKELTGGIDVEENDSTAVLTAFIVAALHQSGLPIPASVKTNAAFCLAAEKSRTDVYSLSIITYAFSVLNDTQRAVESLQKLTELSHSEDGLLWWPKPGGSMALNVETTSYAVLSLLSLGSSSNIMSALFAIRWLSTQRNQAGGFYSTQDTVVGLEALTTFAVQIKSHIRPPLTLNISAGNFKHIVAIDDKVGAAQQKINIPSLPSVVDVFIQGGQGCALVQATMKYNVQEEMNKEGFELTATTEPLSRLGECLYYKLETCVRYTLPDVTSNMAIVTVNFVTGYFPERSSLHQLSGIKRWEENANENRVNIYLEEVSEIPFCFSFNVQRLHYINNLAPALITVYDYYYPERTKTTNYTIICEESPQLDIPDTNFNNIDNFHDVDFELESPSGLEGPRPSYICPENKPDCTLPS